MDAHAYAYEKVRARVALGAALLDRELPGWFANPFLPYFLNMGDPDNALLPLLYWSYVTAFQSLGLTLRQAKEYGFWLEAKDEAEQIVEIALLGGAWHAAIEARQNALAA